MGSWSQLSGKFLLLLRGSLSVPRIIDYEDGSDEESGKDWDELEQEAAKGTTLVY